ncbi:MAG TPA: DUF1631 family protein [Caldimonas sp.]|jgi:hypothetical protein|nr:DUF1631 family protein [Caldimonas sp.]HEX4235335.1 DUF1631 family protein [Caldimonas sp.]
MAIAPLFQRFVDDELALAPALVERVIAGTLQLLGPAKEAAAGGGERVHYADIVAVLQKDSAQYPKAFVESLRRQVAADLDEQRGATPAEATAVDSSGLELMDESRVEVDIEISRAMQLIDSTAEWELRELQTFTSTLIGLNHVTAESNPFRPLTYATALWDAACAVTSAQIQRAIILRTSAGVAAGLLKNACAAATSRLESQGVEPGVYRTVVLPSGSAFGRPMVEPPRQGPLSSLLGGMPQSAPAGAGSGDSRATLPSRPGALVPTRSDGGARRNPELERALLRLDELLRHSAFEGSRPGRPAGNRIDQHRAALVASASEPIDRQIIELVTRLFESLLNDSLLPGAFRPIISRMQVAALRVCLADHAAALDSYDHPIWRLLDRIGLTSQGYSRIEDPRLSAFLAFSGAVAEEMAGASFPDTALFRRGLNRVESFLAEQLQDQSHAANAAIEALQVAERREVLRQHLAQRLTDQMVTVRTSPTIRRFVTGAWARVIAEDMLRHGEQSEETLSALKTVDDLLWSLKIPDHPQSRQRLIALLPGLLQRVRLGMETIALPAVEQQAVFEELMAIHTEALRPGARASGAPGGALSPEEIVRRMREEVVPETPPARSFSDSVIDLSSMETVPAEHMPSRSDHGEEDPTRRIDALRVGDRQRIFLQGRWSRLQLLWRSDHGLFFLFAGESPSHTHSITGRALERLAAAGLVQPVESKPLIQRAVDRMMRDISPRA